MKKLLTLIIVIVASFSYGQFEILRFTQAATVEATNATPITHIRDNFDPPNWNHELNLTGSFELKGTLYWSEAALLDYKSFTNPLRNCYLGCIMTSLDDVFCIPQDGRFAISSGTYAVEFVVLDETQVRVYGQVGSQGQTEGGGHVVARDARVYLQDMNTATMLYECRTADGHPTYFNEQTTLRPGRIYEFAVVLGTQVRTIQSMVNSRAFVTASAMGYIRLPKQVGPDQLGFL